MLRIKRYLSVVTYVCVTWEIRGFSIDGVYLNNLHNDKDKIICPNTGEDEQVDGNGDGRKRQTNIHQTDRHHCQLEIHVNAVHRKYIKINTRTFEDKSQPTKER